MKVGMGDKVRMVLPTGTIRCAIATSPQEPDGKVNLFVLCEPKDDVGHFFEEVPYDANQGKRTWHFEFGV